MDLAAAYSLATGLVAEHLDGWSVAFDSAKRRAGVCRYGERVIGLSAPLTQLHSETEVRDTVLHEIAHALAGPAAGHGPVWRRTARRLGCSGERCVPASAPRVAGPWVGVCPAGHVRDRHRRPERVMSCAECSASFSAAHVLTWTHHGRPAAMHPNYVAELRALARGERVVVLGVGAKVRLVVPGELHGRVGRVVRRGRTRYHVRVGRSVVQVAFAGVEAVRP